MIVCPSTSTGTCNGNGCSGDTCFTDAEIRSHGPVRSVNDDDIGGCLNRDAQPKKIRIAGVPVPHGNLEDVAHLIVVIITGMSNRQGNSTWKRDIGRIVIMHRRIFVGHAGHQVPVVVSHLYPVHKGIGDLSACRRTVNKLYITWSNIGFIGLICLVTVKIGYILESH